MRTAPTSVERELPRRPIMSSFYKTVQGPPAYNRVILNGPISVQRLID